MHFFTIERQLVSIINDTVSLTIKALYQIIIMKIHHNNIIMKILNITIINYLQY